MSGKILTPVELRQKGYQILKKELGIEDFIRFLQQIRPNQGDYTRERHKTLDKFSMDEIVDQIMTRQHPK